MDEAYQNAEKITKKYNQEHLLKNYEKLTTDKQKQLLNQIKSINFEEVQRLYENIKNAKTNDIDSKVEPIPYIDKDKLDKKEKEKYDSIGKQAIKEGKLAAVTMAGGQGTRLGHSGPKGTFDLGLITHKSLFEILCDSLKEAKKEYKANIPWYIMTSEENNKETVKFFEKHNYFGYPKEDIKFFKQGKFPMMDTNGKILLNEEGIIKEAADGHGGVYIAMLKNGVMDDMKKRGVEWIFIGGVDNVLVKMVDPTLMGIAIDQNAPAAGKSVVKAYPEERVGVFCKRDGKPSVIEYTELPEEMSKEVDKDGELKFGESHILCNLFNLKAIEEISKNILPYHAAFKKAAYLDENGKVVKPTEPNAYKSEAFLFDAFEQLDKMAILRVKREEEFAPVKNSDEKGVDCPKTARRLYENYQMKKRREREREDDLCR